MISKAVSWALQKKSKKHPDPIIAYLEDDQIGMGLAPVTRRWDVEPFGAARRLHIRDDPVGRRPFPLAWLLPAHLTRTTNLVRYIILEVKLSET